MKMEMSKEDEDRYANKVKINRKQPFFNMPGDLTLRLHQPFVSIIHCVISVFTQFAYGQK
jgi:hypothetical protein